MKAKSIIAAAGVTPSMRKACPSVLGFINFNLDLISLDRLLKFSANIFTKFELIQTTFI